VIKTRVDPVLVQTSEIKKNEALYHVRRKWRNVMLNNEEGKIGWILLWALGIPIPILVVLFVLRGCT